MGTVFKAEDPTLRRTVALKVMLPHGYLDHLDDMVVPDDDDVMALSGG